MADIKALTPAMASVECSPACRLKCCGSIPTAAKPVITPFAPPAIPAATIPLSQVCNVDMGLGRAVFAVAIVGARHVVPLRSTHRPRFREHPRCRFNVSRDGLPEISGFASVAVCRKLKMAELNPPLTNDGRTSEVQDRGRSEIWRRADRPQGTTCRAPTIACPRNILERIISTESPARYTLSLTAFPTLARKLSPSRCHSRSHIPTG
jgi:hypothetical protein